MRSQANPAMFVSPPQITDHAEMRLHMKQRLAAAFRIFAKFGYDEGAAGHITVRDPELADHFWVNPAAMDFGRVRVSDLVLVDHEGKVVEGRWSVNPAALAIHSHVHRARPDVVAAAHSHSMYGKTWSCLGRQLDALCQDSCAFYQDHGVYPFYNGVVLSDEEGEAIGRALGPHKAVILQNHGLLTVGHSVDAAAWWFVAMERSCQSQLLAEAAGKPIPVPAEQAAKTAGQVGSEIAGWYNFQPLYQRITREQPDLLE